MEVTQKMSLSPHICNKPYDRIEDFNEDLADLVMLPATDTHMLLSSILLTDSRWPAKVLFWLPKAIAARDNTCDTDGEPELSTARPYLHSFQNTHSKVKTNIRL